MCIRDRPKTELQSAKQFYVPVESRPWLIQSGIKQRHAAVSCLGIDNMCSHLILSEASPELRQTIKVAESGDLNLFLVTGQEKSKISKGLLELEKDLLSGKEPASLAYQYYVRSKNNEEKFAAVLIGSSRDELQKEIDAAKSGIETSFTGCGDWNSHVVVILLHHLYRGKERLLSLIREVLVRMSIVDVLCFKCFRVYTSWMNNT